MLFRENDYFRFAKGSEDERERGRVFNLFDYVYRDQDVRDKNLYKSCILFTEFNSPPNLVRDKGIYSIRAGSILTSEGPAWDLRVQLMEHEGEDQ